MRQYSEFENIFLFRPYIDFRKGICSLAALVQDQLKLDPFKNYLFLFCSKNRKGVKMLYWNDTGFMLCYSRLEVDKYLWPSHLSEDVLDVTAENIKNFLSGFNPWQIPHQKRKFSYV